MKSFLALLIALSNGLVCQNSLQWVHSFGQGRAEGVAIDQNSNSVFVGSFSGIKDFDGGTDSYTLNAPGQDAFILKSDRYGNFIWAINVGGDGAEFGNAVAVDSEGNSIVTGKFTGVSDFDPGQGQAILSSNGSYNTFAAKFGIDGHFIWAAQAAGTGYSECTAVAVDDEGYIYMTGEFSGIVDFDPGPATHNLSAVGQGDTYVLKLNAAGGFEWVGQIGGPGIEVARSIAFSAEGVVYIVGDFNQTVDFEPGSSVLQMTKVGGGYDSFICKLSDAGDFIWAKQLESTSGYSWASKVVIDPNQNFYVAGQFTGSIDCDPSTASLLFQAVGEYDGFIIKFHSNGNLIWARATQGTKQIFVHDAACDQNGNLFVGGAFAGKVDFDPGPSTYYLAAIGNVDYYDYDAFIWALDGNGQFACASSFGGPAFNYVATLVVDKHDQLVCAGTFAGEVDFDPGQDSTKQEGDGGETLYISKYEKCAIIQDVPVNDQNQIVRVFPNPCTDKLIVSSSRQVSKAMLFDFQGRTVRALTVVPSQKFVIGVDALPRGVYLLRLNCESEYLSRKVFVE